MRPIFRPSRSVVLAAALAAALAAGPAGCEERVVGTRNDWSGSQLDRVKPQPKQPDATDRFFDDAGEALFGWTRHLTGEQKRPDPRPVYGEVDLRNRRTTPNQSSGYGQ